MDTDNDADSELLELPSEYTEQDNEAYEAFQNMSVSERELVPRWYLAGSSYVDEDNTRDGIYEDTSSDKSSDNGSKTPERMPNLPNNIPSTGE